MFFHGYITPLCPHPPCWILPGHSRAVGRSRALPLLRPEVRWRAGVAGGGTDGPGGLHLHWPRFIIIYLLSKCSFIDTYWFIYWYLNLLLCIYLYILYWCVTIMFLWLLLLQTTHGIRHANLPSSHYLRLYSATLTLLRAGITEGLRIFELPCRWTFNM